MKRTCKVNGKVSYPQNDGVLTTFSFHNPETGEVYAMSTTSQEETDELNYGDTVTLEIKKEEPEEPEKEVEETEVSE
uniref:Riboflavin kinase n=1 Tax=Siphoviridae sp. ctXPh6 TaxID=2827578 RepID=A0A8S5LKC2_9CAUD|nr:MAG TPA: riboflavin kinase [Siphoviridae sp. ctXPh6]DAL00168.1 MAG TPA: riboflavin kinase [Caudoviricetes sp.]